VQSGRDFALRAAERGDVELEANPISRHDLISPANGWSNCWVGHPTEVEVNPGAGHINRLFVFLPALVREKNRIGKVDGMDFLAKLNPEAGSVVARRPVW
jgi:hypothetical protein